MKDTPEEIIPGTHYEISRSRINRRLTEIYESDTFRLFATRLDDVEMVPLFTAMNQETNPGYMIALGTNWKLRLARHVRFMCFEMNTFTPEQYGKASRWIGWAYAICTVCGWLTFDECKELAKRDGELKDSKTELAKSLALIDRMPDETRAKLETAGYGPDSVPRFSLPTKEEQEKIRVREQVKAGTYRPAEAWLICPKCSKPHIDRDEWATRPHRTHLCEHCGHQWWLWSYYHGIEPIDAMSQGLPHFVSAVDPSAVPPEPSRTVPVVWKRSDLDGAYDLWAGNSIIGQVRLGTRPGIFVGLASGGLVKQGDAATLKEMQEAVERAAGVSR